MELELHRWLVETFGGKSKHSSDWLTVGIGDDAATIDPGNRRVVLTSDAIIENVHFDDSMSLQQIGRKALAVNLSDLAATAAQPMGAIVNLCIPTMMSLQEVQSLYEGMAELIDQHQLEIVGGDTNVGSTELILSVTALGLETEYGRWSIAAAKPGDRIVVSGSFGGSRVSKHHQFVPRCELAMEINRRFSVEAATDVSDGLSLDLFRMSDASNVGFLIDGTSIPISDDVVGDSQEERLTSALGDGEDFELILAVSPEQVDKLISDHLIGKQLTEIGEFLASNDCSIVDEEGVKKMLMPTGYLH